MARGINKVILLGNLGNDPETKYMPSGGAVTNISIATSTGWKDKQTGEQKEKTEWHRVVFFNRLAEIAGEYLRKGSQVYVEGRLQTRKWQDANGNDKYMTEIVANEMQMLGSRGGANTSNSPSYNNDTQYQASNQPAGAQSGQSSGQTSGGQSAGGQSSAPNFDSFDDDIPF